jgi:CBS domain-containing protein
MRIQDLMTRSPRTCSPESTLAEAAQAMGEARCGVLPVVDRGKTVGMLTDRDVCLALTREDSRPSEVRVDRAMTRDVHYVKEEETHSRALQLMRRWRVRRLPVLAADGTLRGIVTLDDLALRATPEGEDGPTWADLVGTFQAICERQRRPPTPRPAPPIGSSLRY